VRDCIERVLVCGGGPRHAGPDAPLAIQGAADTSARGFGTAESQPWHRHLESQRDPSPTTNLQCQTARQVRAQEKGARRCAQYLWQ
jgi:hypothetical protein